MSHIFISYASQDQPIAEALYEGLEKNGLKCWIPARDITVEQNYGESIINAIEQCSIMVLVFSSNSNSSQKIIRELKKAVDKDKKIMSFKIENINPCKNMEYYLTNTYNLDATTDTLFTNIHKLKTIINNILKETNEINYSNEVNNPISTSSKVNEVNNPVTIPHLVNQSNELNDTKHNKENSSKAIIFGISAVACILILISGYYIKTLIPSNSNTVQSSVTENTNTSTVNDTSTTMKNENIQNITFEYEKKDNLSSSKFTEEDIVNFAKNAVMELDRLDGSIEFYEKYAYNGPEYNILNLYEDVLFAMTQLEIKDFKNVELMGKNEKPFGIEYLVKMDFICYANYDIKIDGEVKHREGEATLYNNLVIIETNNGELKYLAMDGISEEDLEKRNNSIEVNYTELKSEDNLNTEDTMQSFIPSNSTVEEETLKSVKEIVRENDHKIVAVFVENNLGTAQGSGFFIEDGIIVTNYHVISGGNAAFIQLSDESVIDVDGVICADPYLDLAILKLKKQAEIEPVTLGGMEDVEKGEVAVAIGSPLGLFNTVSTGIISNTWNNDGINLLQISIPITHGNSGGALFDETGKVVGVTTSGIGEADLNFAISTEHLKDLHKQIKDIGFNHLHVYTFEELNQIINNDSSNSSNNNESSNNNKESSNSNQEIEEKTVEKETTSSQGKYHFVRSNKAIGQNLTYSTDIHRIKEVDKSYTVEYAENDVDLHLSRIIDSIPLSNYANLYKDPEDLYYDFHKTYVEEDLEYYIKLSKEANEHFDSTLVTIDYDADNIQLTEIAFNEEGKIDGIIADVDVIKYIDYEEDTITPKKYYFRYDENRGWFAYVGEIE